MKILALFRMLSSWLDVIYLKIACFVEIMNMSRLELLVKMKRFTC